MWVWVLKKNEKWINLSQVRHRAEFYMDENKAVQEYIQYLQPLQQHKLYKGPRYVDLFTTHNF